MDMGSLKGLIDLVAKKKLVITEEELAVITYKVPFLLNRFSMVCSISMIYVILCIETLNQKISCSIPRDKSKSLISV